MHFNWGRSLWRVQVHTTPRVHRVLQKNSGRPNRSWNLGRKRAAS